MFVNAITPATEFEPVDGDFECADVDHEMPENKGELRSPEKTRTFVSNPRTFPLPNRVLQLVQPKRAPSPMQMAANKGVFAPKKGETVRMPKGTTVAKSFTQAQPKGTPAKAQTATPTPPRAMMTKGQKGESSQARRSRETRHPLFSRTWEKKNTEEWWQQLHAQHQQHEREGGGQGKQEHGSEEGAESKKSSKGSAISKPRLERPRTGVFALYYILTKIGIRSDGNANFAYKSEIEKVDAETTTAHKQRLEALKKAVEKEKSSSRWGIATKVFSWIGSFMGLVTGVALVVTGVGAVAGALMIAGSLLQITNQILEMTGGWKKIAELLPGDDPDRKRAVITWMQIGIAVLCLILCGVGMATGGYANYSEASQLGMKAIQGVALIGHGTGTIGEGVNMFMSKNSMSETRRYEMILAELKHKRRDLMEKVEWGLDQLEQLFEDLTKALEFEVELFRADQMVNRR